MVWAVYAPTLSAKVARRSATYSNVARTRAEGFHVEGVKAPRHAGGIARRLRAGVPM
jgi:hypothetical protein